MKLLIENISKIVLLEEHEKEILEEFIERKTIPCKTIIHSPNEVFQYSIFVEKGLLRSFTINDNIHEHIMHFACEGWWIGDMYSLLSGKKGNLFIETLEDSEIILLSRENQELLFSKIPKLERFFRILIENSLVTHQERLLDNLSLSAEERYEKFSKKYVGLQNRIPQKQIAAYLGVTPEFFSKMKNKVWKNK
jgi:CRP/FNR family transcriptional regulator, anaerobic regulatory protein